MGRFQGFKQHIKGLNSVQVTQLDMKIGMVINRAERYSFHIIQSHSPQICSHDTCHSSARDKPQRGF